MLAGELSSHRIYRIIARQHSAAPQGLETRFALSDPCLWGNGISRCVLVSLAGVEATRKYDSDLIARFAHCARYVVSEAKATRHAKR